MDFLIYKEKKSMNKDMKLLQMLKKGFRAASSSYLTWFEPFGMKKNQNIAKDYYVVLAQENN